MTEKGNLRTWMKIFFVIPVLVVLLVLAMSGQASAFTERSDAQAQTAIVNETRTVPAGNSDYYFQADFEAGSAYEVSISWTAVPTFSGTRTGWTIQTLTNGTDGSIGNLIFKTARRNDTASDKSVQNFTAYFAPNQDASLLHLEVLGLATGDTVSVVVTPSNIVSNLTLNATFDIAEDLQYLNGYFETGFEAGKTYNISATWESIPTYTKGSTAWKIQGASNSSVDGDDMVIYRSTRDRTTNTGAQAFHGEFTFTANKDIFNFFTQFINSGNTFHIVITEDVEVTPLGTDIWVDNGNSDWNFAYNFQIGQSYSIALEWTDVPIFTGSTTGWKLQTVNIGGTAAGDLVIKTAKKPSTSGNGSSVQTYQGIFTPTENMPILNLSVQGLVFPNKVNVDITPVSNVENLLLDATISVDNSMEYICAFFDAEFEAGKIYNVDVFWDTAPQFTDVNEGRTAWKVQMAGNSNVFGDDSVIYKITAANNTAPQSYRGVFDCEASEPVFNFFSQRLNEANKIHFIVKCTGEVSQLDYEVDPVTYQVLYTIPDFVNGNVIQGFDIYDDILFQCYDTGYCATYNFNTGDQIAAFPLGSSYSSNHCGNVNFGTEFPAGNTQFPALYVSGDLTTKACYVESVSTTSSQLIQTIYFDINPSYTGGQIIIDKERNRILYMQREDSRISYLGNAFKISEFRIPALSEGSEIHFTNADIIGDPYEFEYYSPLYQGATIYRGGVLQTHGLRANSFDSTVGIMYFDALTHSFDRHIDLTGKTTCEPQSVAVYEDRLIINFVNGCFYELKLNLDVPLSGYEIAQSNSDNMAAAIEEAVEMHLPEGFSVKSVSISEAYTEATSSQDFSADIIIQTPYNCERVTITGTISTSS